MPRKPLLVQVKAQALLVAVDKAAARIKGSRHSELRRQLFKTSLSIVSNISEGREKGDREFLRFLTIAVGSAGELESQIQSGADIRVIPAAETTYLLDNASEVAKMLHGLIKKVRKDLGLDDDDDKKNSAA